MLMHLTFKKPRRPYEKEHLDAELNLVGEYGLQCKRELQRVQYALCRIHNKNPCQIFEGGALLWRMNKYGLLDVSQNKLDYVLALTVESFLERCLHTVVFKTGMAKSIHHTYVLIRQRHIRYFATISFFIKAKGGLTYPPSGGFSLISPLGGGCPGRVERKNQKAVAKKAADGDGDGDEEDE
ncbi:hypothetical protein CsSME_00005160 [Camellia sinensis var. sinensis]